MKRPKLLLVVNPTSGKMQAKSELMGIIKVFCDAEYDVRVHVTRCVRDATRVVERDGADYDIIVACGGDGTFNEVAGGALKIGYGGAVGFLPCGTTNDLAGSLALPKDLREGAFQITYEKAKFLDFGLFQNSRYFSYIASFGAFTEVSYSTDQFAKNLLGHLAYMGEAVRKLKDLRSYRMRVECDETVYEDDFLFGAVVNSLSIGGILKLKESAVDLADGAHEMLLVRNPKNGQDLANLFSELLSGNFENKSVFLLRGREFSFSCSEDVAWCVDGEYAGDHKTVEIQNVHNCLRLIRP